ncbi:hypothetical protein PENANT_c051G08947 [Penicillium antarcticum]|uniref:Uncharacterized protein n=1 Tax=Penicillium antarcticum TaxID=416450 RepID=A0A1V6PR03_9EURO|nr:hypothetical protein PENANT_c051G08947 [Penicillium antarcticum]
MAPQLAWTGLGNMAEEWSRISVQTSDDLQPQHRPRQRLPPQEPQHSGSDHLQESITKADKKSTCVSDDKATQKITSTITAAGDIKDKLFIDCSTNQPETTKQP